MNLLSFFRKQVKTLLERESVLEPEQRSQFQWQMLFTNTETDTTYLVGKGGSHTCFWSINPQLNTDAERHTCNPQEMLDIISSWGKAKYDFYGMGFNAKKFRRFQDLESAKSYKPKKKNPKYRIFGVTKKGEVDILFKPEFTLTGSLIWIQLKKD